MLTEKSARTIKPPETGTIEVPDGAQRGLMLRVSSGGVRTWAVRYSVGGRRRRVSLGRVGEVNLRAARTRTAAILAAVALGQDPAAVDGRLLTDLWTDHARERARVLRHPEMDAAIFRLHVEPALRYLRPNDFRPADWSRLDAALIAKGLAPNTRRSVHRVTSGFFRWLVARGVLESSPVPPSPPARRVVRDRVLSIEELRAVWRGAEGHDVVRLLLLTALRKREAQSLRWSEVEGDRLVIPAARMKGKRPHVVPLSAPAQALLDARRGGRSAFVFPARRGPDRPSGADLSRFVPEDATIHDLRRGIGTALGDLGVAPHVIGLLLAHAPGSVVGGVTSVYMRADYLSERREALERWCEVLRG